MKNILCLAFICLSNLCIAQIPSYNMKDTSVVITDAYFYDEGGPDNGYFGGTKVMTFTSATGQPLCGIIRELGFSDQQFDLLEIFDGNSINAPLLGTLDYSRGGYSFRATGQSITFRFKAGYYYPGGGPGWKARLYTYNPHPPDGELVNGNAGFYSGSVDTADYDKDGDQDLLIGGALYRNDTDKDSIFAFGSKGFSATGNWETANSMSADFNGDGLNDVFIIGKKAPYGASGAVLYLNKGDGTFEASIQTFTAAMQGYCRAVDYNRDGKMDISYTGRTSINSSDWMFKLYLNDGDGIFSEKATGVSINSASSLDWADVDGDNDMDLLINNGRSPELILFMNDKDVFTAKRIIGNTRINAPSDYGDARFADINNDQKLDITISGTESEQFRIYMNNGDNSFSRLATNLPVYEACEFDWADYDADGDLDLLLSGKNYGMPSWYNAGVYKNNGNGNFTLFSLNIYESFCKPRWIDVDGDSRPDIFLMNSASQSYIARNIGTDSFAVASFPLPYMANTRCDVQIADFSGDAIQDLLMIGNIAEPNQYWGMSSLYMEGLGMNYQMVPHFAIVKDFTKDSIKVGFSLPVFRWGDFDNDGMKDILVYAYYGSTLKAYKNMGDNNFTLVYNGSVPSDGGLVRTVMVADMDNDGQNEVIVAPNYISRWDGNKFKLLSTTRTRPTQYYEDTHAMDLGDYNNDGLLDIALWYSDELRLFRNEGNNTVVEVGQYLYSYALEPNPFVKWVDLDRDGDLDISTSRGILENLGSNVFISRGEPLYGSLAAIGDFNGDSLLDILSNQRISYSQGKNLFFRDTACLNSDFNGITAVDIDNDGDDDIVYSNYYGKNALILNNSNYWNFKLSLETPVGGEMLLTGRPYKVNWSGSNLGSSMSILMSQDNGKSFQLLSNNVATGKFGGSFLWIPDKSINSDSCIIQIADNHNADLKSMSPAVFSIGTMPDTPIISGLGYQYCEVANIATAKILNLPDSSMQIFIALDNRPLPADSLLSFDLHALSEGQHALLVSYSNEVGTTTVTSTFSVTKAQTPAVDLSANITNIVSLDQILELTAINMGPGNSPLYTFATDNAFTNVLQASSVLNSYSTTPHNLKMGANKLYVQMSVKGACLTTDLVTDSTTVTRDIITGISGPAGERPSITAYPNPFTHAITLKGLFATGIYYVTLKDMDGKLLYSQRIVNPVNPVLTMPGWPGIYMLTLYRTDKKVLPVTIKVIRTE